MSALPRLRPTIEGGAYISAFIDLLGLSNRLLGLENAVLRKAERAAVVAEARASVGAIARLRSAFQEWYERFDAKATEREAPSHLTAEQRRLFDESKTHETFFQYFGDCVVISVPVEPAHMMRTWHGISAMFAGIAAASLTLLSQGQVCRGGVEIGVSCQPYDNEILGASIVKAYGLEKRARVPRILVGMDLQNFIRQSREQQSGGFSAEMEMRYALLVERLLIADVDGERMVHYLAPEHVAAVSAIGPSSLIDSAKSFIEKTLGEARASEKSTCVEKYEWLHSYMTRYAPRDG